MTKTIKKQIPPIKRKRTQQKPKQKPSLWHTIENLVVKKAREFGLEKRPLGKDLKPTSLLGKQYGELGKSQIFEAGHNGEYGANDCLIHSILFCLSRTFRELKDDKERNVIASFFRREYLPLWKDIETVISIQDLKGKDFLEDSVGDFICNKLNINILWILTQDVFPVFTYNKSKSTICISGDGVHFQPVKLFIDQYTNGFIIDHYDFESYIQRSFTNEQENTILNCNFNLEDFVLYKKLKSVNLNW